MKKLSYFFSVAFFAATFNFPKADTAHASSLVDLFCDEEFKEEPSLNGQPVAQSNQKAPVLQPCKENRDISGSFSNEEKLPPVQPSSHKAPLATSKKPLQDITNRFLIFQQEESPVEDESLVKEYQVNKDTYKKPIEELKTFFPAFQYTDDLSDDVQLLNFLRSPDSFRNVQDFDKVVNWLQSVKVRATEEEAAAYYWPRLLFSIALNPRAHLPAFSSPALLFTLFSKNLMFFIRDELRASSFGLNQVVVWVWDHHHVEVSKEEIDQLPAKKHVISKRLVLEEEGWAWEDSHYSGVTNTAGSIPCVRMDKLWVENEVFPAETLQVVKREHQDAFTLSLELFYLDWLRQFKEDPEKRAWYIPKKSIARNALTPPTIYSLNLKQPHKDLEEVAVRGAASGFEPAFDFLLQTNFDLYLKAGFPQDIKTIHGTRYDHVFCMFISRVTPPLQFANADHDLLVQPSLRPDPSFKSSIPYEVVAKLVQRGRALKKPQASSFLATRAYEQGNYPQSFAFSLEAIDFQNDPLNIFQNAFFALFDRHRKESHAFLNVLFTIEKTIAKTPVEDSTKTLSILKWARKNLLFLLKEKSFKENNKARELVHSLEELKSVNFQKIGEILADIKEKVASIRTDITLLQSDYFSWFHATLKHLQGKEQSRAEEERLLRKTYHQVSETLAVTAKQWGYPTAALLSYMEAHELDNHEELSPDDAARAFADRVKHFLEEEYFTQGNLFLTFQTLENALGTLHARADNQEKSLNFKKTMAQSAYRHLSLLLANQALSFEEYGHSLFSFLETINCATQNPAYEDELGFFFNNIVPAFKKVIGDKADESHWTQTEDFLKNQKEFLEPSVYGRKMDIFGKVKATLLQ
jgi:hypothetical protein